MLLSYTSSCKVKEVSLCLACGWNWEDRKCIQDFGKQPLDDNFIVVVVAAAAVVGRWVKLFCDRMQMWAVVSLFCSAVVVKSEWSENCGSCREKVANLYI
jgi:hypothetical protein